MTPCPQPGCYVFDAIQKPAQRYHWFCKRCGRDVSLEYLMLYEAMNT